MNNQYIFLIINSKKLYNNLDIQKGIKAYLKLHNLIYIRESYYLIVKEVSQLHLYDNLQNNLINQLYNFFINENIDIYLLDKQINKNLTKNLKPKIKDLTFFYQQNNFQQIIDIHNFNHEKYILIKYINHNYYFNIIFISKDLFFKNQKVFIYKNQYDIEDKNKHLYILNNQVNNNNYNKNINQNNLYNNTQENNNYFCLNKIIFYILSFECLIFMHKNLIDQFLIYIIKNML